MRSIYIYIYDISSLRVKFTENQWPFTPFTIYLRIYLYLAVFLDRSPVEGGTLRCLETSVTKYWPTQCNISTNVTTRRKPANSQRHLYAWNLRHGCRWEIGV